MYGQAVQVTGRLVLSVCVCVCVCVWFDGWAGFVGLVLCMWLDGGGWMDRRGVF